MNKNLTTIFPTDIGTIHFIGIGGIGMSGIAEILHSLGYKVQGSDISESYITERLVKNGIKVFNGHNASNIKGAALVVKSTAVKDNNPEIIAAQESLIPIIKRSEMLAELMRFKHSIAVSGTHGKTTTTSLIAKMFETAGLDPSVVNGGVINNKGTNAYMGQGDYLIAEADESDGTFIKVPSYVGVITNIDPEHMDYYGTFDNVKGAYLQFIESLPFYGFGVLCIDHPVVRELSEFITSRKVLSYGIDSADADFRATNININELGSTFDVEISKQYRDFRKLPYSKIEGIVLDMHGRHNVLNALSAIAIGVEKNFAVDVIKSAFKNFGGVKRRFTYTGVVNGVSIIDDYAHHPIEICATLNTARGIANLKGSKVIAVMQPHRYTRLEDLFEDFAQSFDDADHIIIADVYPAGEDPIEGIDAKALVSRIQELGKKSVQQLYSPENLAQLINKLAKNNDLVVLLGAGNVTKWAYDLPKQLQKLKAAA